MASFPRLIRRGASPFADVLWALWEFGALLRELITDRIHNPRSPRVP